MPISDVNLEIEGPIAIVTIVRPDVRNAVDNDTAEGLATAFRRFDADDSLRVAVLAGAGGCFCAGADLKAVAGGKGNRVDPNGDGPLGCTRMLLTKPVIPQWRGSRWLEGSNSHFGAICGLRHATPYSGFTAGVSACP